MALTVATMNSIYEVDLGNSLVRITKARGMVPRRLTRLNFWTACYEIVSLRVGSPMIVDWTGHEVTEEAHDRGFRRYLHTTDVQYINDPPVEQEVIVTYGTTFDLDLPQRRDTGTD